MTPRDYPEFHAAWINAHAMSSSNQTPSDTVVMAVFDLLSEFQLQHVTSALQVHARSSRFAPTPADICQIIKSRTGSSHISADEAWPIALASMDETETVVMTGEIMEARGLAMPLWSNGDKIGARMAFRAAYERIIATANDPVWSVVAGWDASRRLPAVEQAKLLGRLPADYRLNANLLPESEAETTVTALLERLDKHVDRTEVDAAEARRNIANIRAMLNGDNFARSVEEREKKRQAFETHRQNELKRLAEKQGALH